MFGQVKHAKGLALLELALRALFYASCCGFRPKYSGGGSGVGVPLGCSKPLLAPMLSALATLTWHSQSVISVEDAKGAGFSSVAESDAPGGTTVSKRAAARAGGQLPPGEFGWL